MRRARPTVTARAGALAAVTAFLLLLSAPAVAADSASIDHAEVSGGALQLLVSVPGDAAVDLDRVSATIDGTKVSAEVTDASSTEAVRRVTILALDASNSMKGERITGAEEAARAYLASVPANVEVGIVTFNGNVDVALEPTRDRDRARQVLDGIDLGRGTALYDGIAKAISIAGTEGQRQVLLLSDGKDTTQTTLASAEKGVRTSGVRLDAVTLQTGDAASTALSSLTAAGKGSLLTDAAPSALTEAYAKEAHVLARQVLVTAAVPAGVEAHDATVEVSLAAGGKEYTDSAFVHLRDSAPATPSITEPTPVGHGWSLPWPVLLGGVVAIGLGLGGLVLAMGGPGSGYRPPPSVEDQIDTYGPTGTGARPGGNAEEKTALADQFRNVADRVLEGNKDLEARIERRLDAAAMSLKPSEWLLIHAGIAIAAAALGLLLGGGNFVLMLLFLAGGVVAPWVYLGIKRAKRIKAFNDNIADTLQLMASSLSAGLSLAQSLDTVVREGTEPVCSEFKRVIVEARLGVGVEDALEGVAQRMDSKDFTWVVMAIRIQRQVGGNLAELLNTVAGTLRERSFLRRHVAALSAEGRLSAWILGALPPGMIAYMFLTRRSYVEPLYTTGLGLLMCVGIVVLMTLGIWWMAKVTKVEL